MRNIRTIFNSANSALITMLFVAMGSITIHPVRAFAMDSNYCAKLEQKLIDAFQDLQDAINEANSAINNVNTCIADHQGQDLQETRDHLRVPAVCVGTYNEMLDLIDAKNAASNYWSFLLFLYNTRCFGPQRLA